MIRSLNEFRTRILDYISTALLFGIGIIVLTLSLISMIRGNILNDDHRVLLIILSVTSYLCIHLGIDRSVRFSKIETKIDSSIQEAENFRTRWEKEKNFMIQVLRDYRESKKNPSNIFCNIVDKYHEEFVGTLTTLASGYIEFDKGHLYTGNLDLVLSGADSVKLAQKKILAIESGQNPEKWLNDDRFKAYTSVNVDAVRERNLKFERIWVIKRNTEDNYKKIWHEHCRGGIVTYFIYEDMINEAYLKRIDFIILDDETVYVANVFPSEVDGGKRVYNGGRISTRQDDLKRCQDWYKFLKRYAKQYVCESE